MFVLSTSLSSLGQLRQNNRLIIQSSRVQNQPPLAMGIHSLKKYKQLFECQHLLLLIDIWCQSSNLYLNVVPLLTPVLIRHLWQLKTVVFLHWCLICAVVCSIRNELAVIQMIVACRQTFYLSTLPSPLARTDVYTKPPTLDSIANSPI